MIKILMILFWFPLIGFSQKQLEKAVVFNNQVEILVPKELEKMNDTIWSIKYPNVPMPAFALSDYNGEVNLIGKTTEQTLTENKLDEFIQMQLGFIRKKYPGVDIVDNEVKTVYGKKLGILKFITQALDQKIFNCFTFAVLNGKVIVFNFNCIEKLRTTWEQTIDSVVASIKIK